MSRPFGPISLACAALCGSAIGCLGDVPPFQGEGGAGGVAGSEATTGTSADLSASVVTGPDAGSGGAPSASSGGGGAPASSSSSGTGCDLDELPAACDVALDVLACAGLGHTESCGAADCPEGDCAFPTAILLTDPPAGTCSTAVQSVEEVCLECDDAGPAIALATTDPVEVIPIASFSPGMPAIAKIVARGHGRFQLEWWSSESSSGISELFTLGQGFTGFDVPFPPATAFELRVVPASGVLGNEPFFMEIDCAYTVDLASGAAPQR